MIELSFIKFAFSVTSYNCSPVYVSEHEFGQYSRVQ